MEKISGLVSKKVLSLSQGNIVGYVLNIVFDDEIKNFMGCEVVDDESENTFFLNKKDIISVGDECVMIDDSASLQLGFFSASNNPIGKKIYDRKGIYYGRVKEVEIKGKIVKKIITNKCEILPKYIKKIGDDFILFSQEKNSKKQKNQNNFSSIKIDEKISEKLPKIISMDGLQNGDKTQLNSSTINKNQLRQYLNPMTLIGKIITEDLFGLNNELIAKKNEIINKKIIDVAKNHNKLNLLAHFCR